jgi:hypothetical protein
MSAVRARARSAAAVIAAIAATAATAQCDGSDPAIDRRAICCAQSSRIPAAAIAVPISARVRRHPASVVVRASLSE